MSVALFGAAGRVSLPRSTLSSAHSCSLVGKTPPLSSTRRTCAHQQVALRRQLATRSSGGARLAAFKPSSTRSVAGGMTTARSRIRRKQFGHANPSAPNVLSSRVRQGSHRGVLAALGVRVSTSASRRLRSSRVLGRMIRPSLQSGCTVNDKVLCPSTTVLVTAWATVSSKM